MKYIRLLFITLTLSLFASCGGGGSGSSGSNGSLVIGVLNSDSGDLESFGRSITSAIRLAEIEINEILATEEANFRFSFSFKNAATSPALALEKMAEFHAEGVRIVIGPMSSGEADAILDFAAANDMLLISPASTAVSLDKAGDNLIRPVGNDTGQAYAIAEALRYYSTRFYAPLYRGDSYGDSLTTDVGERFEDVGGFFAPGARYTSSLEDYSEFLDQLDVQVEVFEEVYGEGSVAVYVISFDEINDIFAQASRYGRLESIRWYGSDGTALNASLLQNPATIEFMKRTRMLSPIYAGDLGSAEFWRVRNIIEDELGERVKPYAVVAYDSVLLLARTFQSLGTTEVSAERLRDEMIRVSSSVVGATGPLTLSATGDRTPGDYELWQIVDDGAGGGVWRLSAEFRVPETGFSDGIFVTN